MREANSETILDQRSNALEALSLLRNSATRAKTEALKNGGLAIELALYGDVNAADNEIDRLDALMQDVNAGNIADFRAIDVTLAVQALVKDDQLAIPGKRSKINVLGFYNILPSEPKNLLVQYSFKGRMHTITVGDTSELLCPLRSGFP